MLRQIRLAMGNKKSKKKDNEDDNDDFMNAELKWMKPTLAAKQKIST